VDVLQLPKIKAGTSQGCLHHFPVKLHQMLHECSDTRGEITGGKDAVSQSEGTEERAQDRQSPDIDQKLMGHSLKIHCVQIL